MGDVGLAHKSLADSAPESRTLNVFTQDPESRINIHIEISQGLGILKCEQVKLLPESLPLTGLGPGSSNKHDLIIHRLIRKTSCAGWQTAEKGDRFSVLTVGRGTEIQQLPQPVLRVPT